MEDVRIGVIGVAGRGGICLHAHKPGEGSRVVAGADNWDFARDGFKKVMQERDSEIDLYEDYRELLDRKDIDAVFVTTPDFLHEEQGVAALEAGKAVYLEKPMAITVEGCDRLLETAKRTGSKLYLGHNMRHMPVVLKMKEIIDSGAIGEIQAVWCRHFINYGGDAYFKNWNAERKLSTGMLLQKGAHDIDVIHWLAGGTTRSVVGMGKLSVYDKCHRRDENERANKSWVVDHWPPKSQKGLNPKLDIEDHTMIMMQLDNGVQASYHQCHYAPDSCRNYTFIGTEGRIENIGDSDTCQIQVLNQRYPGYNKPDIVHQLKPVAGGHGGADPRIVKEFVDFVREGIDTNTSPVAARNSVATGVTATESLRTDGSLKSVPTVDADVALYFENGQRK